MRSARRSSEIRQLELADAALDIIARQGIAALTTRALASHVGLTTGALFRHFRSLDELMLAVVGRVEVILEQTYPPAELPPAERLWRFVEARSAAVGEQRGVLRLVLSEQFRLALPPGGAARLVAVHHRTRQFLRDSIAEAQQRGELRDDLRPDALAEIVVGTVLALALAPDRARGSAHREPIHETLKRLLQPSGREQPRKRPSARRRR